MAGVTVSMGSREEYCGDMTDYVELLNKLAPEGLSYAGGGRSLDEAIPSPVEVVFNGHRCTN